MTHLSKWTLTLSAALGATLLTADANVMAQCATCVPQTTVAFSPVVTTPVATQPVVMTPTIVRTGWYPGYWIDRMRINRWSAATPTVAAAPTFTAGFAPTVTTGFAPTYTAAYAPATGFATWPTARVTAFAPLQTQVVTTSFAPAVSSGCSSCGGTAVTTSFAPSTVFRPVELSPVVETVAAPSCSTCGGESACSSCSSCSSCAGSATQAIYTPASTSSGCSSCEAAASQPNYTYPAPGTAAPSTSGPPTPQPEIAPGTPVPSTSGYPASGSGAGSSTPNQGVTPSKPAGGGEVQSSGPEAPAGTPAAAPAANPPAPSPQPDDAVEATPPNKSASFDAPQLLGPVNDKTAHRPTVDVHNAVYRQPARSTNVSTTVAAKPAMDANGWYGVANR